MIPNEIQFESLFVTMSDGVRMACDVYASGHPTLVLLVHGFFNSRKAVLFKEMARDLSTDYDVAVMDLRGHGDSTGLFTWTAQEPDDVVQVIEYFSQRYANIHVIGFSLGAASSLIAAAKTDKIKKLILVSAPAGFWKIEIHFWDMDPEENIAYNVWKEGRIGKGVRPGWLWHPKVKPIHVVDQIKCPTLFIHGDKDWLIRPRHSQKLFLRATCEKHLEIIRGGTHAEYLYRRDPGRVMKLFKDWLSSSKSIELFQKADRILTPPAPSLYKEGEQSTQC